VEEIVCAAVMLLLLVAALVDFARRSGGSGPDADASPREWDPDDADDGDDGDGGEA
jgi:hypothetical protein